MPRKLNESQFHTNEPEHVFANFYHMQKYVILLFINSDSFEVLAHTDFKM